jgi:hypothetical protein
MIYLKVSSLDEETIDDRLVGLRNRMQSESIDAYVVTSFNDHQSELKDVSESPLKFISGFSASGEAAVKKIILIINQTNTFCFIKNALDHKKFFCFID